jgi:hypothetical protein
MDKVYVVLAFDANGDSGMARVGLVHPGVFLTKEEAMCKVQSCLNVGLISWYVETTIGQFDKKQMKKVK